MKNNGLGKLIDVIAWVVFSVLIALVVLLVVSALLFFFPGNGHRESSRSLADYERFIHRSYPTHGILFPDESLLTEDNCIFYDKYVFDGSNTPESLTYALCMFSEEEFD